jgi:hypothetical protein
VRRCAAVRQHLIELLIIDEPATSKVARVCAEETGTAARPIHLSREICTVGPIIMVVAEINVASREGVL